MSDTPAPTVEIRIGGRQVAGTLSTAEAAQLIGISPFALRQWEGSPNAQVRPLRFGNKLRWPTLSVAELIGAPVDLVVDGDVTIP